MPTRSGYYMTITTTLTIKMTAREYLWTMILPWRKKQMFLSMFPLGPCMPRTCCSSHKISSWIFVDLERTTKFGFPKRKKFSIEYWRKNDLSITTQQDQPFYFLLCSLRQSSLDGVKSHIEAQKEWNT